MWLWSSKLLLVLASRVILGSESHRTHDDILLFHDSGGRPTLAEICDSNSISSHLWSQKFNVQVKLSLYLMKYLVFLCLSKHVPRSIMGEWMYISARTCKKVTVRIFRHGCSQQNARWIRSSPLIQIMTVGSVGAITGTYLQCVTLSPSHNAAATTVLLLLAILLSRTTQGSNKKNHGLQQWISELCNKRRTQNELNKWWYRETWRKLRAVFFLRPHILRACEISFLRITRLCVME
jgi:hypothetical protein